MPNRLSKEKAQAIAQEYCTHGYKKTETLVKLDYSPRYAKGLGLKLYDNVLVKAAICEIQAKSAEKTAMTVERVQTMYEEDREFASKVNQAGARVSATTGIARLYGMDKDAGARDQTVIVISPKAAKEPIAKQIVVDYRPIIDAEKAEEADNGV